MACLLIHPRASSAIEANGPRRVIENAKVVQYRNAAPRVAYLGSKACESCHADIYNSYQATHMGRSMKLVGEPERLEMVPVPVTTYNKILDRYFKVFRDHSNVYQSEYELGPDGKDVFRSIQKIDYVIGTGANGFTFVARRGSYLVQAPLSYYSKTRSWALSPGYDIGDYGFSRTILPSCIVCHSGRPNVVSSRYGLYMEPPFFELAIGCENCHGPGQLHVDERQRGKPFHGPVDTSIVNPARLPVWLADNICMSCHQGGDVRVLKPGKSYMDFRPGMPLDDTVAIFAIPLSREAPPNSPLLQHYFLMTLSRCYQGSNGRLGCQTCHDPHQQPSGQAAAAYFRNKCLGCHTEQSCRLPIKTRQETSADDCAGCHMPKQNLAGISHSALTNHRIIASKGEPNPEYIFRQPSLQFPNLIHLDAVPGAENSLDPVTLLQAYGELMGSHPIYRERHLALLDRLARTQPENPVVLAALGRKNVGQRTPKATAAAIRDLSRAIDLGSAYTDDYELLAQLLWQSGRIREALAVVRKGVEVDPYNRKFYSVLVQIYVAAHDYSQALRAMRDELQLFPQDSSTRSLVHDIESAEIGP